MIVNIQEWDREALNELLAQAEIYAKRALAEKGEIAPTLFMHGADDTAMLRAQGLTDDRSKDKFAATARLMCLAHAANATVFVSEGWMAVAKKRKELDMSKPPSQYAERHEILMIMGETRFEHETAADAPVRCREVPRFRGAARYRGSGRGPLRASSAGEQSNYRTAAGCKGVAPRGRAGSESAAGARARV
jgi:hypothetical protein